jgi:hypothetical protein
MKKETYSFGLEKKFVRRGMDPRMAALGVGLRPQNEVIETPDQRADRYARQQAKRKKTLTAIKSDRRAKRAAVRRRKARWTKQAGTLAEVLA